MTGSVNLSTPSTDISENQYLTGDPDAELAEKLMEKMLSQSAGSGAEGSGNDGGGGPSGAVGSGIATGSPSVRILTATGAAGGGTAMGLPPTNAAGGGTAGEFSALASAIAQAVRAPHANTTIPANISRIPNAGMNQSPNAGGTDPSTTIVGSDPSTTTVTPPPADPATPSGGHLIGAGPNTGA